MKILDLGCGNNLYSGSIGIDKDKKSKAHIICDIEKFPYPFHDNTFDMVVSKQVFEHLADIEETLNEIYRISKDGAKILIQTPHFTCYLGYGDPSHKRTFSFFSFDVLAPKCGFQILEKKITFHKTFRKYKINLLANHFSKGYERFWAFILPAEHIHFKLLVDKKGKK